MLKNSVLFSLIVLVVLYASSVQAQIGGLGGWGGSAGIDGEEHEAVIGTGESLTQDVQWGGNEYYIVFDVTGGDVDTECMSMEIRIHDESSVIAWVYPSSSLYGTGGYNTGPFTVSGQIGSIEFSVSSLDQYGHELRIDNVRLMIYSNDQEESPFFTDPGFGD